MKRRAIALVAVCALGAALGWRPAREAGVTAMVVAPNHGISAFEPAPDEIRVDVGPPAASLSLQIVEPRSAAGTVFVLHGIRAAKQWMRGWGTMLADAGYRAVLVDLRGHGRSTGDFMSYGVVEARDLSQALDALERRGLVTGK